MAVDTGVNMIKTWLLILFCVVNTAHAFTLKVTEAELQQKIEKKIPLDYQTVLIGVELTKATVDLGAIPDAITMRFALIASLLGEPYGNGTLHVHAKPRYDRDTAALYLDELTIDSMKIDDVQPDTMSQIIPIVELLLQNNLAKTPVYKFDEKGIRALVKKSVIKSVEVKHKQIIIVWSPLPF